jgi:hypothetical protein
VNGRERLRETRDVPFISAIGDPEVLLEVGFEGTQGLVLRVKRDDQGAFVVVMNLK